jgi:hypothetical protein
MLYVAFFLRSTQLRRFDFYTGDLVHKQEAGPSTTKGVGPVVCCYDSVCLHAPSASEPTQPSTQSASHPHTHSPLCYLDPPLFSPSSHSLPRHTAAPDAVCHHITSPFPAPTPAPPPVAAPIDQPPPVFVRGGSIIALHTPALTTAECKMLPYTLMVRKLSVIWAVRLAGKPGERLYLFCYSKHR